MSLEFSLRKRKWLCIGSCKAPNQHENVFLDYLTKELTNLAVRYDKFILLGDSNLTIKNKNLNSFLNVFNLETLVTTPKCFKSNNLSCIDLIISNKKTFLKNSCTVVSRIYDHHYLVATILKSEFIKVNPTSRFHKDYISLTLKNSKPTRIQIFMKAQECQSYFLC